jgi:hypothetical protein
MAHAKLGLVDRVKDVPDNSTDRRLMPVYSVEEAAGYLRIPINTLRSWTLGRRQASGRGYYEPVLKFVNEDMQRLSFYDLVEAHILRAAVDQRVPLQQLRRGLEYLREHHPDNQRPLLAYNFHTDGSISLSVGC